jgi:hypothetical protein
VLQKDGLAWLGSDPIADHHSWLISYRPPSWFGGQCCSGIFLAYSQGTACHPEPPSTAPAHTMVSFDEALIKHIGQFGPGQWRILSASSLCLIANAAAFFFWTLATVNPVQNHSWECVNPTDSACQAVKQQELPSRQAFCALPAGSTRWTSQGACRQLGRCRSNPAVYELLCMVHPPFSTSTHW